MHTLYSTIKKKEKGSKEKNKEGNPMKNEKGKETNISKRGLNKSVYNYVKWLAIIIFPFSLPLSFYYRLRSL